jgi:hypothetical protein
MKLKKENKELLKKLYIKASEIFYFPVNPGNIKHVFNLITSFLLDFKEIKNLFLKYKKIIKYNKLDSFLMNNKINKYLELMRLPEEANIQKLKQQLEDEKWMPLDQFDFNYTPMYIISSLIKDIKGIREDIKSILDYHENKKSFIEKEKEAKRFLKLFRKS